MRDGSGCERKKFYENSNAISHFALPSLCRVTSLNANDSQSLSFCKGLKLVESGCVENVLQVGKSQNETIRF